MASAVSEAGTKQAGIAEGERNPRPLPRLVERPVSRTPETGRFRNRIWHVVVVVVMTAVILAWQNRQANLTQQAAKAEMAAAAKAESPPSCFALGRLEPLGRVVAVSAPEGAGNARIKTLKVHEGNRVESGAVLAVLDNEDRLMAERESARRGVRLAAIKVEHAEILARSMKEELTAALKIAEISRDDAQIQLLRQQRLQKSRAISQEELDRAERDLDISVQTVAQTRSRLARYESANDSDPIDVAVHREELAVAEAALSEALTRLDQAYVKAPFAGTVLELNVRSGEPISQKPLLDLGATDAMTARVEIYETDVRNLRPGQAVIMRSPALERPLNGKVERIADVVKQQSMVDALPAANTDARVVETIVRLDDESGRIAARYIGLQVRAEFLP